MHIESWSITDIGKKRDHNEDNHLCNDGLGLYIVADGMGGHKAGEVASQIAVEAIEEEIANTNLLQAAKPKATQMMYAEPDPIAALLTQAVRAASGEILDRIGEDANLTGMGTTVTLLFVVDGKSYYAHVGDSRVYRIRENEILQLSTDHSLVQEQVDAGLISHDEAENSVFKNVITRSVGFERDTDVDVDQVDIKPGDLFLICSDGLSNRVSDHEIRDIIQRKDPETALGFFVNLANSRGGDDNITAILVKAS